MAEQRLIDANALIDWLTRATGFQTSCDDCTDIDCLDCVIEKAIKNAPTVEAKPVVHAHWEDKGWAGMICSNCGENAIEGHYDYQVLSKYCPYCGAQMDEGASDTNVGRKEPFSQAHENGVKIPVISMEDVPKIMEELPSVEENPILKAVKEMEK